MYMLLKDAKRKVVTLSYDDGVYQDIRLISILNKYGLKCTFNINSGLYADEEKTQAAKGRLKLSEAKKLYTNSGHEVAIHGFTHPFLERLNDIELVNEIVEDKKRIENDYGVFARGMAYPFGTYNQNVIDVIKKYGIVYSRTTKSTEGFGFPKNWLELNPTLHHNNPRLMELAQRFAEEDNRFYPAQMFYLWGHSYEFDDKDNWYVIEKFAEYIGNRDDIWYATNIEIYDYVTAYNRLVISADQNKIYNPSAIDVWVQHHKNNKLCIKSGAVVCL